MVELAASGINVTAVGVVAPDTVVSKGTEIPRNAIVIIGNQNLREQELITKAKVLQSD